MENAKNRKPIHFEGHLSISRGNIKRQRPIEKITVFVCVTRCSFSGGIVDNSAKKYFLSDVIQKIVRTENTRKFFPVFVFYSTQRHWQLDNAQVVFTVRSIYDYIN